jgi:hypothetical protein
MKKPDMKIFIVSAVLLFAFVHAFSQHVNSRIRGSGQGNALPLPIQIKKNRLTTDSQLVILELNRSQNFYKKLFYSSKGNYLTADNFNIDFKPRSATSYLSQKPRNICRLSLPPPYAVEDGVLFYHRSDLQHHQFEKVMGAVSQIILNMLLVTGNNVNVTHH